MYISKNDFLCRENEYFINILLCGLLVCNIFIMINLYMKFYLFIYFNF